MGNSRKKSVIIAVLVLVVLVIAAAVCWFAFKPQTLQGSKNIVVEVNHKDGTSVDFEISTDAEYLYDAMKQEGLIGELENGMFDTVDSETIDPANEEWWGYTKAGEYVNVGLSECVIADGDHYEFNFNIGYDNWQ